MKLFVITITHHRTIKMKPIDVRSDSYAEYNTKCNEKGSKFQVGDHVRTSKYKNVFAKGYASNWSKEVFEIKRLEIQFHEIMLLVISMVKKLLEPFMKNKYRRQMHKLHVK